jgi:hypothetical protein
LRGAPIRRAVDTQTPEPTKRPLIEAAFLFDALPDGRLKSAAQARQVEELTLLTRRAAIRGPLPSDQPADWR